MSGVRTRFAPSPTGHLHVGGARTALFSFLYAKAKGGTFVLRIEDTDEVRSTADSTKAILDGMQWLGLTWDEGPDPADPDNKSLGSHHPYYQAKRAEAGIYREFVDRLLKDGNAYKCFCQKEELEQMKRIAKLEKRPPVYDRRCLALPADERQAREDKGDPYCIRFKMPLEGETVFHDAIHGRMAFENRLLQDYVIIKASGWPTYNFACVVDDHLMGITHVIRGDDHLSNTPSQVATYVALGLKVPEFAHLSMILGPDGTRLSKRHGATSVYEFRDLGYLPRTMQNYLALLGWSTEESENIFSWAELQKRFDLDRCQKSPAVFDMDKLLWMNGHYMRELPADELFAKAKPWLDKAGLAGVDRDKLKTLVALEQEKYKLFSEIPALVDYFFKDVEYDEKAFNKVLAKDGAADILKGILPKLEALEPWTEENLEKLARDFAQEKGVGNGKVFHPLRVSTSGRQQGPSLFAQLYHFGKPEVLKRVAAAIDAISQKISK